VLLAVHVLVQGASAGGVVFDLPGESVVAALFAGHAGAAHRLRVAHPGQRLGAAVVAEQFEAEVRDDVDNVGGGQVAPAKVPVEVRGQHAAGFGDDAHRVVVQVGAGARAELPVGANGVFPGADPLGELVEQQGFGFVPVDGPALGAGDVFGESGGDACV